MRLVRCIGAGLLACLLPATVAAQNQGTIEERLRAQLRTLNAQNQQLQAEKSSMQTALRNAEGERDVARKDLLAVQGDLEASRQRAQGLAARQRQVEESAAAQARQAEGKREASEQTARGLQQQLSTSTRDKEKLTQTLQNRETQLQSCGAMNTRLVATGKEILRAYEQFDVVDAIAYRQPFAAGMRVRLENEAQSYGDKLHENQFDPRAAVGVPKTPQ